MAQTALDLSRLSPGRKGSARLVVGAAHTAPALGSGTIPVFATPMMVALMEAAAVDCVESLLPEGHTSLGTSLAVSHSAASPPGALIEATAELVSVDDRTLTFRVEARDAVEIIGAGTHTRVVADTERFKVKLARKAQQIGLS